MVGPSPAHKPLVRSHRSEFRLQTLEHLREEGIPMWQVDRPALLSAYGIPPIKTRQNLRQIAKSVWPALESGSDALLDAALLGLYVQTERLFIN